MGNFKHYLFPIFENLLKIKISPRDSYNGAQWYIFREGGQNSITFEGLNVFQRGFFCWRADVFIFCLRYGLKKTVNEINIY